MYDARTDHLARIRHTACRLSYGAPVISDPSDADATWYPATWLTDQNGSTLQGLLEYVTDAWGGSRHVAAALAFKGYAYAAALPVVVGWLGHKVVPLLESETLRVGLSNRLPYVRVDISGVRTVATDQHGSADVDAATLAHAARTSLLEGHLAAIIETLTAATRVGTRLLWGSVAESVAHVAVRLTGTDGARRALVRLGEPVDGLVEIADGSATPPVRRRTCCLWFATDTGENQYCANCPVPS